MRFRPCIDIHNGKVKQIVGSSLDGDIARENFVSEQGGEYFARLYKSRGLSGGHIILLNPCGSEYYEADCAVAQDALREYSGGLQVGGGINPQNAERFLDAGASHVIVTSYVFKNGAVSLDALEKMTEAVGKDRLVLDLSCKKYDDGYYIVTDRWTKKTDVMLTKQTLDMFSGYCDELLVHAVDVEGKAEGIDSELAGLLSEASVKCTYAGGIRSFEDIELVERLGKGRIDFTIGSALDIFGGHLPFEEIAEKYR